MIVLLVAVLLFPYIEARGLDAYTYPESMCETCRGFECLSAETRKLQDCSKDIPKLPEEIEKLIDPTGKNAHYMCINFKFHVTEYRQCILTNTDDVCKILSNEITDCKLAKPKSDETTTHEPTTVKPDPTTHQPDQTTTSKTETTPSKPDPTTSKPETTPSKPDSTTSKPETTPSEPDPTTSKPETTPSKPDPTTSKPETTPSKPDPTTSKPETTTNQPTTSKSETTTVVSTQHPHPTTEIPVHSSTEDDISTASSTPIPDTTTEGSSNSGSVTSYPILVPLYLLTVITFDFLM